MGYADGVEDAVHYVQIGKFQLPAVDAHVGEGKAGKPEDFDIGQDSGSSDQFCAYLGELAAGLEVCRVVAEDGAGVLPAGGRSMPEAFSR